MRVKRALLSVFDKTDIVDFARNIRNLGIEIYSSGGTSETLEKNGVEVNNISDITGFSEILGGRVKTLNEKVHASILADRDQNWHMRDLDKLGISPIDMVVVNFYPFQKIAENSDSMERIIENIDIGGPTLLRSAAKNYKNVVVVTDPNDYEIIVKELSSDDGQISLKTRRKLAAKAFSKSADYEVKISNYFKNNFGDGEL